MNRTISPELVGKDRMEGLSLEFQLTELKESRSIMLERILNKVARRSSEGMVTPTRDFEGEISRLKDFGMKLAWRKCR